MLNAVFVSHMTSEKKRASRHSHGTILEQGDGTFHSKYFALFWYQANNTHNKEHVQGEAKPPKQLPGLLLTIKCQMLPPGIT